MITYKKATLLSLCMLLSSFTLQSLTHEESTFLKDELEKLLPSETDSFVIQECKKTLAEKHETSTSEINSCFMLISQLKAFKVGDEPTYKKFIAQGCREEGVTKKMFEGIVDQEIDSIWQESKKNLKNRNDKNYIHNLYTVYKTQNGQEGKKNFSALRQWILDTKFKSIKFLVKTLCEELGKPELAKTEKKKVLELFKKFDNK